jgi:hypothetical protein
MISGAKLESSKLISGLQKMLENADECPPPKRTRTDIQSIVESIVDENHAGSTTTISNQNESYNFGHSFS